MDKLSLLWPRVHRRVEVRVELAAPRAASLVGTPRVSWAVGMGFFWALNRWTNWARKPETCPSRGWSAEIAHSSGEGLSHVAAHKSTSDWKEVLPIITALPSYALGCCRQDSSIAVDCLPAKASAIPQTSTLREFEGAVTGDRDAEHHAGGRRYRGPCNLNSNGITVQPMARRCQKVSRCAEGLKAIAAFCVSWRFAPKQ